MLNIDCLYDLNKDNFDKDFDLESFYVDVAKQYNQDYIDININNNVDIIDIYHDMLIDFTIAAFKHDVKESIAYQVNIACLLDILDDIYKYRVKNDVKKTFVQFKKQCVDVDDVMICNFIIRLL